MSDLSHSWLGYLTAADTDFRKSGPDGDVTKKLGSGINYLKDQMDSIDASAVLYFDDSVLFSTYSTLISVGSSGTLTVSPNGKEILFAIISADSPEYGVLAGGASSSGLVLSRATNNTSLNKGTVEDVVSGFYSYYSALLVQDLSGTYNTIQYTSGWYFGALPGHLALVVTLFYKG